MSTKAGVAIATYMGLNIKFDDNIVHSFVYLNV